MSVAIVTGAARGIGFAIAEAFVRSGMAVVLWDVDETVEQSASSLEAQGATVLPMRVDVARSEDVDKAVAAAEKTVGPIDVLVNNAAITRPAMLHKMEDGAWDAVLGVNLSGVFYATRAVARVMMPRSSGAIVNVAALSGLRGALGQINYVAAKAGVLGMTKAAAKELARYSIRVNAVAPGIVETAMSEKLLTDSRFRDGYLKEIPLGRVGQPSDIADVVLFLASEKAGYLTGHVVPVCGGSYM